jgi:hypothetical protein
MSIRSEIESRLLAWADAQTPKVPVALEGVGFTKPATGGYVSIFFLDPMIVNPDVAAERERETGIFQIDVCLPSGTGTKACEDLASSVRALFPVLPKRGTVSIESPPQKSAFRPRTDGYLVCHVSVSYRQER